MWIQLPANDKVSLYSISAYVLNTGVQRYPTGYYLFKRNNGNTRTMCEIYSKLTIKTPEPSACFRIKSIFR